MFWKKKKNEFACKECGKVNVGWPALAYSSPSYYNNLSKEDKEKNAFLSSDFCEVQDGDCTYYFIRAVLIQKVNDSEEDLQYGLWVSLSEKSYNDYKANYNNDNYETGYFGWLSSNLPDYDNKEHIGTDVITQKGNQRPEIIPHQKMEIEFVKDYYNGISSHEAQRRVDAMMKRVNEKN